MFFLVGVSILFVGKIGLSRLRSEEVLEISASIGSQPPKQHTTGGYADANLNRVNFPLAKCVCDFWCKPLEFARDRKHERYCYAILQVVIPVELLQHLQELVAKSYNFACLVAKWRCHHQAREIEHKRHLDIFYGTRSHSSHFMDNGWSTYPSLTSPPQKQRFKKALSRETND